MLPPSCLFLLSILISSLPHSSPPCALLQKLQTYALTGPVPLIANCRSDRLNTIHNLKEQLDTFNIVCNKVNAQLFYEEIEEESKKSDDNNEREIIIEDDSGSTGTRMSNV